MKLPFIGLVFEDEFSASRLNNHLVNFHKASEYIINLEPVGNLLKLTLICEELSFRHEYGTFMYSHADFQRWHRFTQPGAMELNFSHLTKKYDREKVVRTNEQKLFVLRISGYRLILPDFV